jgi:hypothetical protein
LKQVATWLKTDGKSITLDPSNFDSDDEYADAVDDALTEEQMAKQRVAESLGEVELRTTITDSPAEFSDEPPIDPKNIVPSSPPTGQSLIDLAQWTSKMFRLKDQEIARLVKRIERLERRNEATEES